MNNFLVCTLLMAAGLFRTISGTAQDEAMLLAEARALEISFHDNEALAKFLVVLSKNPNNLEALCHASELYTVIGKRKESKDQQKEYFLNGNRYAKKAVAIAPNNSEANFALAISLGRIAQISPPQEKIKAVRDIKYYADRCVQIDPKNFKGYYLIGRWNYEVSDLSALERWLVKITFGALPPSSLDAAIQNYRKSMELNPAFILNYYELARAYRRNDEIELAKKLLQQMQTLPPSLSDDDKIKALGRKMLGDL